MDVTSVISWRGSLSFVVHPTRIYGLEFLRCSILTWLKEEYKKMPKGDFQIVSNSFWSWFCTVLLLFNSFYSRFSTAFLATLLIYWTRCLYLILPRGYQPKQLSAILTLIERWYLLCLLLMGKTHFDSYNFCFHVFV